MLRIMIGEVYLLHFHQPLGNPANPRALARHYLGWAEDARAREREHRAGTGTAITRAAVERGIDWQLFVLTPGDWHVEKRLKALKNSARLCPICGVRHPAGRLHLPVSWLQLELPWAEVDPWATVRSRPDYYEISARRRTLGYTGGGVAQLDSSGCDIPF